MRELKTHWSLYESAACSGVVEGFGTMLHDSTGKNDGESVFDSSYEIIGPVGRGRNSVVYKARTLSTSQFDQGGTTVALKILVGNSKNPLLHFRRMKREALAMLSSVDPNVVKLNDYVTTGQLCYLSMEYAEQGDLKRILDEQDAGFKLSVALELMIQVSRGLEKINRVGILHRDIKPENLLLNENGMVKIADFGIACLPTEKVGTEEANRGIGTFDYLAPESLEEGISSETTDVYACAVTFYQLLTAHFPFGGVSFTEQIENKMAGEVLPISSYVEGIPARVDQFLRQALQADPERRFRSAKDFRVALERLSVGTWEPEPEDELIIPQISMINNVPQAEEVSAETEACQLPDTEVNSLVDEWQTEAGLVDESLLSDNSETASGEFAQSFEEFEESSFVDDFLARFYRPKWVLVFLASVGFSFLFLSGSFSSWSREIRSFVLERAAYKQSVEPKKKAFDFSVLVQESHSGFISGLFSEEDTVSVVTVPASGGQNVLFVLALDGWQPVALDAAALVRAKELRLQSRGIDLTLHLDAKKGTQGSLLSGSYKEHSSGSQGTWAIW